MKKLVLVLIILCIGSVALPQDVDKHRIGVYLGYFMPVGEYTEPGITLDFEDGANFGVEYTYSINRFVGIGAFLEGTSFASEKKTFNVGGVNVDADVDVTSTIFGVSGVFTYRIERVTLYGSGKLGVSNNSVTANAEAGGILVTYEEDGSSVVFILEGGGRYNVSNLIDIGLGLKYTVNSQEVEDVEEEIDLGGLAIMAGIGFNF